MFRQMLFRRGFFHVLGDVRLLRCMVLAGGCPLLHMGNDFLLFVFGFAGARIRFIFDDDRLLFRPVCRFPARSIVRDFLVARMVARRMMMHPSWPRIRRGDSARL